MSSGKLVAKYEATIEIRHAPGVDDEPPVVADKVLERHLRVGVIDSGDYLEEEVSVVVRRTGP